MAKGKKGRYVLWFIILCLLAGAFIVYQKFFRIVQLKDKSYVNVFIRHGDSFEDVTEQLNSLGVVENTEAFTWLAEKMQLDQNLHPGKYRINNGMTLRQIINLLKYNKQEKVKLTYNSQIRDLDEFVVYTDEKLELTSEEIEDFLSDEKKLHEYFKLDPDNAFALIVPGVLEVGWAITSDELFMLLKERYNKLWNKERLARVKRSGFSQIEIVTLASIVQSESSIKSEQEKIAGVYINRLKIGMLLQADPTLKFANKSYDAQRILDADKQLNSPYNTYLYKGLPPGPICLVTTQAIDATLNYQKHKYIFFCAKPQLNGYSDYSVTYEQHRKYALAYQKALDKMGISR